LNRPREREFKQFKSPRPQCVKLQRFSYIIGPKVINRSVKVARLPKFICGEGGLGWRSA